MEILGVRPGWSTHHCMEEYEAKRKPSEPLAPREMESRVCLRGHGWGCEPWACVICPLYFLSSLFRGAFNLWDTCGWGKNPGPGNWRLLAASCKAQASHFSPVSVSFSRKVRDSELFRLAQILPLFKSKGKYGILIKTWKYAMVMINIILIKDIIVGWVLPQFPARVPCLFQRETNIMTLALSLRIVLFFYKNKNNLLWENGVGDLAICHPQPRQWNRSSCSWILVVGSVYCLVFLIPAALGPQAQFSFLHPYHAQSVLRT